MDSWIFIAVVLGLVEGATEFLPVSSTGHLILAGHLIGFDGERANTFEIFIQLGAILAVVEIYWRRFVGLLNFKEETGFHGLRGIGLLALTTLPGFILGFFLRDVIKQHLFTPVTVAIGLIVGGLWILWAEKFGRPGRQAGLDSLNWKQAFYIGLFQCLALWPGMSRASSTILGGMISGLERKTATVYSFFAAVPMLVVACLYDLWKSLPMLTSADVPFFGLGLLVSFVSAWVAVRFFIHFLAHHTLIPFGWYRVALAVIVFALMR